MPHAPGGPLYVLHAGEKGYANTKLRVSGHAASRLHAAAPRATR